MHETLMHLTVSKGGKKGCQNFLQIVTCVWGVLLASPSLAETIREELRLSMKRSIEEKVTKSFMRY